MNTFKPTWLYIKQHNLTGLKYFGKTTKKDPYKYKGSGLYWRRHINVYGDNISTPWTKLFNDQEELITFAINFSVDNNIVDSSEWANVKIENGLDGGSQKGRILSESCRRKLSIAGKKRKQTEITKEKISKSKQGKKRKPFSQQWKDNLSANHRSKKGYVLKVSNETKQKISNSLTKPVYCVTNNTWYNSRAEAAKILGLKVGNIGHCVNGYQKSTGGYIFAKL